MDVTEEGFRQKREHWLYSNKQLANSRQEQPLATSLRALAKQSRAKFPAPGARPWIASQALAMTHELLCNKLQRLFGSRRSGLPTKISASAAKRFNQEGTKDTKDFTKIAVPSFSPSCQLRALRVVVVKSLATFGRLPFFRKGTACFAVCLLAACQANWVSPYSQDLQKRATDMLAEVTALEITMAQTTETSAADPAKPPMQTKLAGWAGEVEAMAAIESSIDPQSAACDKLLNTIAGGAIQSAESQAAPTGAADVAGSAPIVLKCESLPDTFSRMRTELVLRIPKILGALCTSGQKPAAFAAGCQDLFKPAGTAGIQARHSRLFTPLIVGLNAIIFREGQQAPKAK